MSEFAKIVASSWEESAKSWEATANEMKQLAEDRLRAIQIITETSQGALSTMRAERDAAVARAKLLKLAIDAAFKVDTCGYCESSKNQGLEELYEILRAASQSTEY